MAGLYSGVRAVGLISVVALFITPITYTTAKDQCKCESQWRHTEQKCSDQKKYGVIGKEMTGCPSLERLSDCEDYPQQSWCYIQDTDCAESRNGANWTYCDPVEQETMFPFCECESFWSEHNEQDDGSRGSVMYGCPDRSLLVGTGYDTKGSTTQSWCKTKDARCHEQGRYMTYDGEEASNRGEGWAFCDADTSEPELPDCECAAQWQPDADECDSITGHAVQFEGCPSNEEYSQQCAKPRPGTGQPWCRTTFAKCKQQSFSNSDDLASMVGQQWSYCTPPPKAKTGVVVKPKVMYPQCQCKAQWSNTEGPRCAPAAHNAPILMEGCPSLGDIRRCENQATDTWCVTTYEMCEEQNYESDAMGWSYCNHETNTGHYGECECKKSWEADFEDCDEDVFTNAKSPRFRGCPALGDFKSRCDPSETYSWCETMDQTCRGQKEGVNAGEGWVECDFSTQLPVVEKSSSHVATAIGVTFIMTVIFSFGVFALFIYAYKQYLVSQKRGYSQELLQDEGKEAYDESAYDGYEGMTD